MKKRMLSLVALAVTATMVIGGCGTGAANGSEAPEAQTSEAGAEEAASLEEAVEAVASPEYANINFDFAEDIKALKEATKLVPDAADINLTVADEKGASGVVLVPSVQEGNTSDFYLNAMVAGDKLTFAAKEGAIASAASSVAGDLEVSDAGVEVVPVAITAADPVDEVITITMEDGTAYNVHTVNETMCTMNVTGEGVPEADAGVYTFAVDHFLLRVSTDGEILYYRNIDSIGTEMMGENFATQIADDGVYYTYFVELKRDFRNANGGYSSGMYVVMNDKYEDIDTVTLAANDDANHTHGDGFLDQHEFLVLENGHYMALSYTPEKVSNLPEGTTGIDGGSEAFVWAGIFQEIKDGKAVKEISTTDYPMLYETSVEKRDYAGSTDQGTTVVINQNEVPSLADGWQDYVHVNSLDYTKDKDGNTDKLLVSMRDQSAVYQFDFDSGDIEWILGGKASSLTGFDEYTTPRKDEAGNEFNALTFGQHYARYCNKNDDGTMTGNPIVSIFDNQTGSAPFITATEIPTLTRTFKAEINNADKTATISEVINGTDLNQKTDKYHIASHCGSVDYQADGTALIGWGLHGVIDNIGPMAPEGTIGDKDYPDLRQGSRPIFTEYDPAAGTVEFELSVNRNANYQTHEGLFSYRTYKTAK